MLVNHTAIACKLTKGACAEHMSIKLWTAAIYAVLVLERYDGAMVTPLSTLTHGLPIHVTADRYIHLLWIMTTCAATSEVSCRRICRFKMVLRCMGGSVAQSLLL